MKGFGGTLPLFDSNSGLPYSKPMRYYLSHTAPYNLAENTRVLYEVFRAFRPREIRQKTHFFLGLL
jgi:hypothetical protein